MSDAGLVRESRVLYLRHSVGAACAVTAGPRECAARMEPHPLATAQPRSQYALLRERRFAPFFWTQFLGAANDNVFKNAFVVFVTFEAAHHLALDAGTIVNLIGAVFILPFMLLSATSGQLADKFEKSRLIRLVKLLEIAIMAIGLAGFVSSSVALLFVALALLGVHSTLFGPVKYAILPQHLSQQELVGGNGLVEAGTFVAILLGTIAGGIVVAIKPGGPIAAGVMSIAIAAAGWLASTRIPMTPAVAPDLAINPNPVSETWRNIGIARENMLVWRSMLGISWFWFYGAIYLAQLPAFTQRVLGGDEHVFTLLLALFSIGIGVGSLLCERLSDHRVELGLVPFGSIGLTLFAVDLWLATRALEPSAVGGIASFAATGAHWRVGADIVLLGVFGGFYTVPLYALIQSRSQPSHRSRIIAANNILNALFIVVSAGIAIGLLSAGLSIPQLFLAVGVMNALVAAYLYTRVPEFVMRFLAWLLVNAVYRVRREGLENIPDDGACVIVCNHVSYVDAIVIAACVRRPVRFVIDQRIFRAPILSFVFRAMRAIPIPSPRDDSAVIERAFAEAASALAAGEIVGIFPEGRLTATGELNRFGPAIARIVQTTPVPVIPMALRGLWGSTFSRARRGRTRRRAFGLFSCIGLVAAPPVRAEDATPEALFGRVLALRGDAR